MAGVIHARPPVRRLVLLAERHAAAGAGDRARSLLELALDIAAPGEVASVLSVAERVLNSLDPRDPPSRPRPFPQAAALARQAASAAASHGGMEAQPAPPSPAPEAAPPVAAVAAPRRSAAPLPRAEHPSRPQRQKPRSAARARRASGLGLVRPLALTTLATVALWSGADLFWPSRVSLAEVERAILQGEAARALRQLDAVADPGDARVLFLRGRALLVQGDTAAAVQTLLGATRASNAADGAGPRAEALLRELRARETGEG